MKISILYASLPTTLIPVHPMLKISLLYQLSSMHLQTNQNTINISTITIIPTKSGIEFNIIAEDSDNIRMTALTQTKNKSNNTIHIIIEFRIHK